MGIDGDADDVFNRCHTYSECSLRRKRYTLLSIGRICGKRAFYATLIADASFILPISAGILAASAGRMTSRADLPQMRPP